MANPFLVLGGVAVGVIAAGIGVLQVPGWIDSANDSATISDLSQVSLAQESASTASGSYTDLESLRAGASGQHRLGVKLQPSSEAVLGVDTTSERKRWAAISVSRSGNVFVRTSDSTKVYRSSAKVAAGAALSNQLFADLPDGAVVGGSTIAPTVALAVPMRASSDAWHTRVGSASGWTSSSSLPGFAVHEPGAGHTITVSADSLVSQQEGFVVSADLMLSSGTPLAGIALANDVDIFTVAVDQRSGSNPSTASLQMRKNIVVGTAAAIAQTRAISRETLYSLRVAVTGTSIRSTLVDASTGVTVADVTMESPYPDFTEITKVGVYGNNGATISNLAVR